MKKILALLLALTMMFALAACSGSDTAKDDNGSNSGGNSSKSEEPTEAPEPQFTDDRALPGMTFEVPNGFTSVERLIDKKADGTLKEKNVKFYYDEDTTLSFAYSEAGDDNLADMLDLEKLESMDCDGKTFYYYPNGNNVTALAQVDKTLYGVEYARKEGSEDQKMLDDALKNIKFESVEAITENDEGLEAISYELDSKLKVARTVSVQQEDTDANLMKKAMTWYFGDDADDPDFRFLIRVVKNSKVADELNEETEYVDEKLGDVDCKVRKEDDHSIEYFAQIGDDVYEIKNLGTYNGWMTSRSDESYTAFEAFVKTISFNK